jgi:hypothetical protein
MPCAADEPQKTRLRAQGNVTALAASSFKGKNEIGHADI